MQLILQVFFVFFMSLAYASAQEQRQISVTGSGEISARPNMATITVGVEVTDRTAGEALRENSRRAAALLTVLAEFKIEDKDIQTSNLSLQPRWDQRNNSNQAPRIIGYTAQNLLNIRIRDIDALGEILDAVTKSGANRIQQIGFGISDPTPFITQARQAAILDARAKAELYTKAAGVTLGKVLSISETGSSRPAPYARARGQMEAMSVPIAEGEVSLSARINMTFALE